MKKLKSSAAPHIIIPTIAGSGSETSTNALVFCEDAEAKVSFTPTRIVAEVLKKHQVEKTIMLMHRNRRFWWIPS